MTVQTNPLVSVIMCVYNAGVYLRPAVASILEQTYSAWELLIVDDGSTDSCMESIRDLVDARIRIMRKKNEGKPAAMNVALDAMKGDYYVLNDADDLSDPRRIEQQVKCLQENSDVAGVFCGHSIVIEGREMAPLHRAKDRARCKFDIDEFRMPGHDPTAMYRMSMVGNVRYCVDLPIVEGFDYILRVGERHPLLVIPECLYRYRIHGESVTRRDPAIRDALVDEVLVRAYKRRGLNVDVLKHTWRQRRKFKHSQEDNNLAAHFMESACDLRRMGKYLEAIKTGTACLKMHPLDPHYYKALVFAVTPEWTVRRLRRSSI